MNKMESLIVGEKYPYDHNKEGIILEYDNGFTLHIFLPNISAAEADGFKKGKYRFALTEKEGILFFISEFKGATTTSDSPFHFGLYNDNRQEQLPKSIDDGEGLRLVVTAIDNVTGIVKSLRMIGLSTSFSRELIKICLRQINDPISKESYNEKIIAIQKNYSSKDLLKFATAVCKDK